MSEKLVKILAINSSPKRMIKQIEAQKQLGLKWR